MANNQKEEEKRRQQHEELERKQTGQKGCGHLLLISGLSVFGFVSLFPLFFILYDAMLPVDLHDTAIEHPQLLRYCRYCKTSRHMNIL